MAADNAAPILKIHINQEYKKMFFFQIKADQL